MRNLNQTENEEAMKFEKLFKETYLKQPIETILNDFLKCHRDLDRYIMEENEREEQLMMLIRTEVYDA